MTFSLPNESERQTALSEYAILDTLPEQDYDELTQLASQICQVPISMITLVDDKRQWFKSTHGLSAQETPKEGGFCTHTISHPTDLSIIEDARINDQFAQHPLVTGEPHIVFYAGAPLIDAQGFALGSLCVIDTKPRQLSQAQRSSLAVLAKQVVNLLTLRKQNKELSRSQERHQREQVALASSEARFRSLIHEAPVATGLYVGPTFIFEVLNPALIKLLGKGDGIIGKSLLEAMPELVGQPFPELLAEVYRSGNTYQGFSMPADVITDGVIRTYYFDFTYKPLRNTIGDVYAILATAVDVTEQVLARQKMEKAETALRSAIELAELGTWELDATTYQITYSDRIKAWFGFSAATIMLNEAYNPVRESDRSRVAAAISVALQPGSPGLFDEEYTLVHQQTGAERIIRALGETFFDAQGKPVKLTGTAQDVTQERRLQQELEQQVQERTRQLQESVQDLERSNANLQQFAYVASHDLQEPLRKIQSFGDMLHRQYSAQLGDTGTDFLGRMQTAASRMSTLIRDLLAYSRISTQPESSQPVPLDTVLDTVLSDLDLVIHETGAVVTLEPLPTVVGDQSQLTQLFGNLLTNALKFRRSGVAPVIDIRCRLVAAADLPPAVRPTRKADTYHAIDVADNGIGFDEKYVGRIFQVFQRLHGKNEFAGTGIGLAICEKVVANHGGVITASSQPGQGATFGVYLPAQIN